MKWYKKPTEQENAWKVNIGIIIERGYDLDIKNPNKKVEEVSYNRKEIIENIKHNQTQINHLISELEQ